MQQLPSFKLSLSLKFCSFLFTLTCVSFTLPTFLVVHSLILGENGRSNLLTFLRYSNLPNYEKQNQISRRYLTFRIYSTPQTRMHQNKKALKEVAHLLEKDGFGRTTFIQDKCLGPGLHSQHYKFETSEGSIFIKLNNKPNSHLVFQSEMESLKTLYNTKTISCPQPYMYGCIDPLVFQEQQIGGFVGKKRKSGGKIEDDLNYRSEEAISNSQDRSADYSFLAMEYIPTIPFGPSIKSVAVDLGSSLAKLHLTPQDFVPHYGFQIDTFLGPNLQNNEWEPSFSKFFLDQRLIPCLLRVIQSIERNIDPGKKNVGDESYDHNNLNRFDMNDNTIVEVLLEGESRISSSNDDLSLLLSIATTNLDKFASKVESILKGVDKVTPSLCHGDLWQGNTMASKERKAYIVDPGKFYIYDFLCNFSFIIIKKQHISKKSRITKILSVGFLDYLDNDED